jgi:hypothetical protein
VNLESQVRQHSFAWIDRCFARISEKLNLGPFASTDQRDTYMMSALPSGKYRIPVPAKDGSEQ